MKFDNYELRLLQSEDKKYFFQLIQNNLVRLEDFVAGIVAQTKTESEDRKSTRLNSSHG